MFKRKLLLGFAVMGLAIGLASTASYATDQDVDATIQTRAAITLVKSTDMDFGIVDYAAVHSGNIQLGTDGTPVLSGAVGLTLSGGMPTAGNVNVSGNGASIIEITCEMGGTLTDGGANTLTLSATEFTTGAGGAPGTGTACAGLGIGAGTVDLSITPAPTVLMGGTLDTTANAIDVSATYSTANAGGDPVTLRVVYQ